MCTAPLRDQFGTWSLLGNDIHQSEVFNHRCHRIVAGTGWCDRVSHVGFENILSTYRPV